MQKFVVLMIIAVTTFDFLATGDHWGRWVLLPGPARYVPEILGLLAAVAVVFLGTQSRFRFVSAKYWLVFGSLALTIACGILVNQVPSGPVVAGIRVYLRALAWFFIPAIYAFSNAQLTVQFRTLLIVAALQLPLALQQRLTSVGQGKVTGDWTSGTLMLSSIMSIFLIGAVCVTTAFYLARRLSRVQFLFLFVLFFIPTTINETKGTLLLLPVGLLVTFVSIAEPGRRFRGLLVASSLVAAAIAVYVPIYDYLVQERQYAVTLQDYANDPARLRRYLERGTEVGDSGKGGRVDSIAVPLKQLVKDPVHLAFGFGIGNVSHSTLGRGFVGEHFERFAPFLTTAFSRIVLELGLIGTLLIGLLLLLIYRDASILARRSDPVSRAIGAGMAGVTVIMGLSLFYKDIISQASLAFLFWFLGGVVAAARVRSSASGPSLRS